MESTTSDIQLVEVTAENLRAVIDLEVAEHQRDFVAPNAVSIAQHCYNDSSWMRAVYVDDSPAGFVLLSERPEVPRYYLWRFMIDHRFQGKGVGRRALELVIDHVRTLPQASEMYLTYVPHPDGPRDFYAAAGFVETGEAHDGELEMRLDLL